MYFIALHVYNVCPFLLKASNLKFYGINKSESIYVLKKELKPFRDKEEIIDMIMH